MSESRFVHEHLHRWEDVCSLDAVLVIVAAASAFGARSDRLVVERRQRDAAARVLGDEELRVCTRHVPRHCINTKMHLFT